MFRRIKTLTLMQLGEKLDTGVLKKPKKLIVSILYKLLAIGLLSAFIFVLMYGMKALLHIEVGSSFFIFVIAILQLLSILFAISGLSTSMYLANDNQLLFSYPARHNEVFISKMLVFLVYELLRNSTYLLPFLIAFGLSTSLNLWVGYWPMMIVMLLVLSLIPVLIGVLISIPVIFIKKWLKDKPVVATLLALAFGGLLLYGVISFLSSVQGSVGFTAMYHIIYEKINNAIAYVVSISLYCKNIAGLFFNFSIWKNILIILAICLGLLTLAFLISRPIYFKMAVGAYEFTNKKKRKSKFINAEKTPFISYLSKEFKLLFRSSDHLVGNFIFLLFLPIILLLLNKLISSYSMVERGEQMLISFNILLGLAILLSSNTESATAFSKEGDKFYLLKISPVSIKKQALAKVTFNILISCLVMVITSISIAYATDISGLDMTLILFLFIFVDVAHIFWSIDIDLMNPQFKLHANDEFTKENKNVQKSISIGILLAILFAVGSFLLFTINYNTGWIKLLIIAAILMIMRIYLFFTRISVYFKHIEM